MRAAVTLQAKHRSHRATEHRRAAGVDRQSDRTCTASAPPCCAAAAGWSAPRRRRRRRRQIERRRTRRRCARRCAQTCPGSRRCSPRRCPPAWCPRRRRRPSPSCRRWRRPAAGHISGFAKKWQGSGTRVRCMHGSGCCHTPSPLQRAQVHACTTDLGPAVHLDHSWAGTLLAADCSCTACGEAGDQQTQAGISVADWAWAA
jgi:hypothetical protein